MKSLFKFICCGAVDDGKSSLIGQMLLRSHNVKKDQLQDALKASLKNGSKELEPAMLLDGLLSEREQQITIDVAHRYFDYEDIRFHILDCPGHEQYTQNMAIAAAQSHTAVVVIDCLKGIQPQTRRHIDICALFRIKNLCICLTKCDLISTNGQLNKELLDKRMSEIEVFLKNYSFAYKILPVSAVTGLNVDALLKTLTEYARQAQLDEAKETAFVMHINMAKMFKNKRYYYGLPLSVKEAAVNDELTLYPLKAKATITQATHGCLSINEQLDVSAGDCFSNVPVFVSNTPQVKTIWFSEATEQMLFKHGTRIARVIRYNDNMLELDKEIIFNNIDSVKQNGFGIFIDAQTKRTIGCAVFENNTAQTQTIQNVKPAITLSKKALKEVLSLNDKNAAIDAFAKLISTQGLDVQLTD